MQFARTAGGEKVLLLMFVVGQLDGHSPFHHPHRSFDKITSSEYAYKPICVVGSNPAALDVQSTQLVCKPHQLQSKNSFFLSTTQHDYKLVYASYTLQSSMKPSRSDIDEATNMLLRCIQAETLPSGSFPT